MSKWPFERGTTPISSTFASCLLVIPLHIHCICLLSTLDATIEHSFLVDSRCAPPATFDGRATAVPGICQHVWDFDTVTANIPCLQWGHEVFAPWVAASTTSTGTEAEWNTHSNYIVPVIVPVAKETSPSSP
jgi:hypothetical protein